MGNCQTKSQPARSGRSHGKRDKKRSTEHRSESRRSGDKRSARKQDKTSVSRSVSRSRSMKKSVSFRADPIVHSFDDTESKSAVPPIAQDQQNMSQDQQTMAAPTLKAAAAPPLVAIPIVNSMSLQSRLYRSMPYAPPLPRTTSMPIVYAKPVAIAPQEVKAPVEPAAAPSVETKISARFKSIFSPKRDEARRDESRRDESRRDEARRDESRRDEARRDEARKDGARRDEARKDEARKDEARRDEARRDESRRDESRRDEARQDETRRTHTKQRAKKKRSPSHSSSSSQDSEPKTDIYATMSQTQEDRRQEMLRAVQAGLSQAAQTPLSLAQFKLMRDKQTLNARVGQVVKAVVTDVCSNGTLRIALEDEQTTRLVQLDDVSFPLANSRDVEERQAAKNATALLEHVVLNRLVLVHFSKYQPSADRMLVKIYLAASSRQTTHPTNKQIDSLVQIIPEDTPFELPKSQEFAVQGDFVCVNTYLLGAKRCYITMGTEPTDWFVRLSDWRRYAQLALQ